MELRERAPEGLIPWIKKQKDIDWPEYLIYKAGYFRDPMTGLNEKCADVICSACGEHMKLGRAYDVTSYRGNASFGVSWISAGREEYHGSGAHAKCPECGKEITVLHTSAAKNLTRYVWAMTIERAGQDLVCYMWRVERITGKDGTQSFYADPWEAVIFGEKSAGCYKHWYTDGFGKSYAGDAWHPLSEVKDRFYDIDLLYCPEGITNVTRGTWMENSKLELYMAVKGEYLFPIVWLRLYQRRHKAETLMTCGAAKLVAGIIAEEKKGNYQTQWTTRLDVLKDLDWRKKKPAEILRLTKQELPYFADRKLKNGVLRLRVIEEARKKGHRIRPGDEAGDALTLSDQISLIENGIMPAFVTRYLDKQKRRYKRESSFYSLKDYWSMAHRLGIPLDDRDARFPQNLRGKHDELVERINEQKARTEKAWNSERQKLFDQRFERMSRYSWEHDGILIRPAASEKELQQEGAALHHCVSTYAKRHASGELTIFFIRRAEEPDKPWFTLDFNERDLSVNQNRGLYNCERTPEVRAFEDAWLAWVRAGYKRINQKVVCVA